MPLSRNKMVLLVGAMVLTPLALAVGAGLAARSAVAEVFRVPSASMFPTVHVGETMVVSKSAYGVRLFGLQLSRGAPPQHGDVVVFEHPQRRGVDFVSRVVGVGGDRVRVLRDGSVELNGASLVRCAVGPWPASLASPEVSAPAVAFVERNGTTRYLVLQNAGERGETASHYAFCGEQGCTVPAGQLFVLSDQRDNAYDGRFWGFVPIERVRGRAERVLRSGEPGRSGAGFTASESAPGELARVVAGCP